MFWKNRVRKTKENVIDSLKVEIDAVARGIEIDGGEIEINGDNSIYAEIFIGGCKVRGVYKYEVKKEPMDSPCVVLEFHPRELKMNQNIKCY